MAWQKKSFQCLSVLFVAVLFSGLLPCWSFLKEIVLWFMSDRVLGPGQSQSGKVYTHTQIFIFVVCCCFCFLSFVRDRTLIHSLGLGGLPGKRCQSHSGKVYTLSQVATVSITIDLRLSKRTLTLPSESIWQGFPDFQSKRKIESSPVHCLGNSHQQFMDPWENYTTLQPFRRRSYYIKTPRLHASTPAWCCAQDLRILLRGPGRLPGLWGMWVCEWLSAKEVPWRRDVKKARLQPVWGILILRPDTDSAALHPTQPEAQIGNQSFWEWTSTLDFWGGSQRGPRSSWQLGGLWR